MKFTHKGINYRVIVTPWTGVWIVGDFGVAYRDLVNSGQNDGS